MAMKRLAAFLKDVRIVICAYYEEKSFSGAPQNTWWVILISLDAVVAEITAVVERVQDKTTLIKE